MTILHPVSPDHFRQQAWANGKGRTTELAAGPDPAHWRWRISMARIEQDGPFSLLPGVRRQLAPLDGGLELHFGNGERLSGRRLQVLAFDGGRAVDCHLPDGPGRDLNLMLREGIHGELMTRPLAGTMRLPPHRGRWFILQLAGHAKVDAEDGHRELETGHALWAHAREDVRVFIEGAGEIALVRLAPDD